MPLKLLGTKLYAHCIKKKDILWLSALAVHCAFHIGFSPEYYTFSKDKEYWKP